SSNCVLPEDLNNSQVIFDNLERHILALKSYEYLQIADHVEQSMIDFSNNTDPEKTGDTINESIQKDTATSAVELEILQYTDPRAFLDFIHIILVKYLNILQLDDKHLTMCSNELDNFLQTVDGYVADFSDWNYLFTDNQKYAHETFDLFFNVLSSTSILNDLQNQEIDKPKRNACSIIFSIVQTVCESLMSFTVFTNSDFDSYIPLLEAFITYISRDFESLDTTMNDQLQSLTSNDDPDHSLLSENQDILALPLNAFITNTILVLINTLANKTILVPVFVKTGYPKAVLNWITLSYLSESLQNSIMHVINNIARHDIGADALNMNNALSALQTFKENILDKRTNSQIENQDLDTSLLYSMTVALLSDPEQIKKGSKTMNKILDQLLRMVIETAIIEECRGYHLSEPLVVLTKLFMNDDVVDYVLKHAQVEKDDNKNKSNL
ncbi:unnamed protein product, partial [Didymodactylos carnosus]